MSFVRIGVFFLILVLYACGDVGPEDNFANNTGSNSITIVESLSNSLLIVVEDGVYNDIQTSLAVYQDDIRQRGYASSVIRWQSGSAAALKDQINEYYQQHQICGAPGLESSKRSVKVPLKNGVSPVKHAQDVVRPDVGALFPCSEAGYLRLFKHVRPDTVRAKGEVLVIEQLCIVAHRIVHV